jgi:hypothetical protein
MNPTPVTIAKNHQIEPSETWVISGEIAIRLKTIPAAIKLPPR